MYETALTFAKKVYTGQIDKSGEPYIKSLLKMVDSLNDETTKTVALLHSIIENTDYTCDDLVVMSFSDEVMEAVECLTRHRDSGYKPKNEDEDYRGYLNRISYNECATKVKLADLRHNMDLSRLPVITEKDKMRAERYKEAFMYLSGVADLDTGLFAAWGKAASYNNEQLEGALLCGCFYCLEVFSPTEIDDWCDGGETAICPHCGVDSIISGDSGYPITKEFLELMHGRWFCVPEWEDTIIREEITEIARQFIESEEMADHLRTEHLRSNTGMPIYRSCGIVAASNATLQDRISALIEIADKVSEITHKLSEDERKAANSLESLVKVSEIVKSANLSDYDSTTLERVLEEIQKSVASQ